MALEDTAHRGPTDRQSVVIGQPLAVFGEGRIGPGFGLSHHQVFLLGRQSAPGAGDRFGRERLARAEQGTVAHQGTGADANGVGDLGGGQTGVIGLQQPFTEITGVGGGHGLSLPVTVNLNATRSRVDKQTNPLLERSGPNDR